MKKEEKGFGKKVGEDWRAYGLTWRMALPSLLGLSTFWLVVLYRMGHWCAQRRIRLLPAIFRSIGMILYGADIAPAATIGAGFRIAHSVGIVIGGGVKAGENFEVFQNITLGGNDQMLASGITMPQIGDNVTVFAGAVVAGPLYIEDNSAIGANAVVLHDVPANIMVGGIPAKKIADVDLPHAIRSLSH